tara:strand:- start:492 stop:785 length:294 start_codon:yes stop_codon:yes gene_type:complete
VESKLEARQFLVANVDSSENRKRSLTAPLFLCKIDKYHIKIMDKGKLKVLLFDLKNIVNEIESEVYSDVEAYTNTNPELAFSSSPTSYDEVFEDDDG